MPEKPFALTQNTPAPPQAEDYDAIHTAVMETSRGNWFLTEFARRNRNADTALLLAAIKRIESAMRIQTAIPAPSHVASHVTGQAPASGQGQASAALGHQLHELRDAIVLTRESLPTVGADGRIALRNADFARIATGIERVASHMRERAQQAQETAQSLRERAQKEFGIEKDTLDRRAGELEAQARELAGFCAQLDEQTESARMVATLLAEIEAQLDGMIARHKHAPAEPVVIEDSPPAPEPQAAVVAQPQPAPESVQTPEPAAAQAAPEPAAIEPAAAPETTAPPDNRWRENLAPPMRARHAPDIPANVDIAEETKPAIALPNPAMREAAEIAPEPAPPKPQEQVAQTLPAAPPQTAELGVADARAAPTPMVPRIKVMPQDTLPTPAPPPVKIGPLPTAVPAQSKASDDPADFLFEPLPQMPQPESHATNDTAHATPGLQPAQKPRDPLAPIMALSEEEKIALFS